MTWLLPQVPVDPGQDYLRRLLEQQRGPVTLEGCTDEQLEAERQRRKERREREVDQAIRKLEALGYRVEKAP